MENVRSRKFIENDFRVVCSRREVNDFDVLFPDAYISPECQIYAERNFIIGFLFVFERLYDV